MSEFVVRNGLIVSGSAYLESISQSNEAYILSYDSVTNEVAYMPTSSVVVTVPGADTQIIYNNGGVFGASSNLVFSGSRVGIGTTSPARSIDVVSAAGTSVGLKLNSTATGGRSYSFFSTNNASGIGGGKFGIYDDTAQASRITLDGNGNVGIGTTNPAALLDVNSGVFLSRAGSDSGVVETNGDLYFNIDRDNSYSGNAIWFGHNNSGSSATNLMTIQDTGNVGIGITNPGFPLAVVGAVSASTNIFAGNNIYAAGANGFVFGRSTSEGEYIYRSSEDIRIYAGGADRLTIAGGTGNVGIGSTSPGDRLDVSGSIKISYPTGKLYAAAGGGFSGEITPFQANGHMILNVNYPEGIIVFQSGSAEVARFRNTNLGIGTTSPSQKFEVVGNIKLGDGGQRNIIGALNNSLGIYASPNSNTEGIIFSTDNGTTAEMFIQDGGNVGIGTTNPAYKLQVNGAIYQSGTNFTSFYDGAVRFGGTNSYATIVNSSGSVGIGTTNPAYKLDVIGTFRSNALWTDSSANAYWGNGSTPTAYGLLTWDTGIAKVFATSGNRLDLGANGSVAATINTSGNVGIGTTNPATRLAIQTSNAAISVGQTAYHYGTNPIGLQIAGWDSNYTNAAGIKFHRWTGSGTVYNTAYIGQDYNGAEFVLAFRTDSTGSFQDSQSTRMVINNSGSVGIGVTTPGSTLDVAGVFTFNTTTDLFQITNDTNTGGINLSGGNSRIYFGGYRAIEGAQNGSNITIGEGYSQITLADDVITQGNISVLGAVSASSFTGSFSGTATNAVSASYAATASSADAFYVRGSVGIGTTSPGAKLDVYASSGWNPVYTTSDTLYSGIVADSAASALDIHWVSGYPLRFSTSTAKNGTGYSEKMRITSAGNVGIGTTNPIYKLHVVGSTYVNSGTLFIDSGEYIRWGNSAQGIRGVNDTSLEFVVGSSTRMYVSSSGNVGIGTTTPAFTFDVNGAGRFNDIRLNDGRSLSSTSGGTAYVVLSPNSGNITLNAYDNTKGINLQLGAGNVAVSVTGSNVGIGTTNPSQKLEVNGNIQLSAKANSIFFGSSGADGTWGAPKMTRIGTQIIISDFNGVQLGGYDGSSYGPRFTVIGNGNVGIGTTNPSQKLEVSGSGYIIKATANGADSSYFQAVNGSYDYIAGVATSLGYGLMGMNSNHALAIMTNAAERMRITSAGSVGIGITNPDVRLHVNEAGTVNNQTIVLGLSSTSLRPMIQFSESTGVAIGNGMSIEYDGRGSGATNKMYINGVDNTPKLTVMSGGNIGIGISSPTALLHVSGGNSYMDGDLTVTGAITAQELYVEYISSSIIYSTGSNKFGDQTSDNHFFTGSILQSGSLAYFAGSVGIGTATPAGALHVYAGGSERLLIGGDVEVRGSTDFNITGANRRFSFTNGTGTIRTTTANNLYLETNSTTAITIDSSQRVGIGTTNPAVKLHVSASGIVQRLESTSTFTQLDFYNSSFGSVNSRNWAIGANLFNWGDFNIMASATSASAPVSSLTYFTIDNLGNVGIGTTNPNYKLEVSGSTNVYHRLDVGTGIDFPAGTSNAIATFKQAGSVGGIILQEAGGTSNDRILKLNSNGDEQSIEATYRDTGPYGNLVFKTGGSNRMFISNSGNVGIGTTNPTEKLSIVQGSSAVGIGEYSNGAIIWMDGSNGDFTGGDYFNIWTPSETRTSIGYAGGEALTVTSGSRVGIGTTSPGEVLEVVGNIRANVSNGGGFMLTGASASGLVRAGATGLALRTDTADRLTIDVNGNVGIGTTSPVSRLHVDSSVQQFRISGNTNHLNMYSWASGVNIWSSENLYFGRDAATANKFFFQNGGGTVTTLYVNTATGNVGIGNSSPSAKLEILSGSLKVSAPFANVDIVSSTTTATLNFYGVDTNINFIGQGISSDSVTRWRTGMIAGRKYVIQPADGSGNFTTTPAITILSGSGNVGIGTTSPGRSLQLQTGDGSGNVVMGYNNTSGTEKGYVGVIGAAGAFIDAGAVGDFFVRGQQKLHFSAGTNGDYQMTMDTSGYVGIGVTNPVTLLHINGICGQGSSGALSLAAPATGGGCPSYIIMGNNDSAGVAGPTIISSANRSLSFGVGDSFSSATGGNFTGSMWITGVGNVGIGTSAPSNKLEVLGSATIRNSSGGGALNVGTNSGRTEYQYVTLGGGTGGTDYGWQVGRSPQTGGIINDGFYIYDIKTNNAPFAIALGGNVGIGTTNPPDQLSVGKSTGTSVAITTNQSAGSNGSPLNLDLNFKGYADQKMAMIRSWDESSSTGHGSLTFWTNYFDGSNVFTEKMRITPLGNVGIGTTNPSQKLSVVGDFAIANTTSIQESRIGKYQSGSLGIGTHTIASISVTNVDAVFFDYVVKRSTTEMRAGTVMAVTNGSTVEYTDISTNDIGDTSDVTMLSDVSGGNVRLRASIAGGSAWTIRTLLRTI